MNFIQNFSTLANCTRKNMYLQAQTKNRKSIFRISISLNRYFYESILFCKDRIINRIFFLSSPERLQWNTVNIHEIPCFHRTDIFDILVLARPLSRLYHGFVHTLPSVSVNLRVYQRHSASGEKSTYCMKKYRFRSVIWTNGISRFLDFLFTPYFVVSFFPGFNFTFWFRSKMI